MVGIPGLENIGFGGGGLGTTMTVITYIFYGLIIGAGGYMLIRLMRYNVIVEIKQRTGDNTFITVGDKGCFQKDPDNPLVETFGMLRNKQWSGPLDKTYLEFVKKGFGYKKKVTFIEDSQGRLQPVKLVSENDVVKFRGWDNNSSEFVVREARKVIDRFKKPDFMSKYGALLQIGAMALIFIMAIVLFRQIGQVNEGFAAVAASLDKTAIALSGLHSAPLPGQVIG